MSYSSLVAGSEGTYTVKLYLLYRQNYTGGIYMELRSHDELLYRSRKEKATFFFPRGTTNC